MEKKHANLKKQILEVLSHPEAQEGLYFRNFFQLHEEDERPAIEAEQEEILEALRELMDEGKVSMDESEAEAIFMRTGK